LANLVKYDTIEATSQNEKQKLELKANLKGDGLQV
jgi:hypothetical protein